MRHSRMAIWTAQVILSMAGLAGCQGGAASGAAAQPIPLEQLAVAAERELGALMEINETNSETRKSLGVVNGALIKSGLARGLPTQPAVDDAESCFRNAAASHGLQVASIQTKADPQVTPVERTIQPGEHWNVKEEDLLGKIHMRVVIQGPLPQIAQVIDEQTACTRIILVRSAKAQGSEVTIEADAWYEQALGAPKLDLRWRTLDERLVAAGWRPDDPALKQDPAYERLRSALEVSRPLIPRVRDVLYTTVEMPRMLARVHAMARLKQQSMLVRGVELLGVGTGG